MVWCLANLFAVPPVDGPNSNMAYRMAIFLFGKMVANGSCGRNDILRTMCHGLNDIIRNATVTNDSLDESLRSYTHIDRLFENGIATYLARATKTRKNENGSDLLEVVLQTCGAISSLCDERQLQTLITCDLIVTLQPMLDKTQPSAIRAAACWILGNIASGMPYQIERLISTPQLVHTLVTMVLGECFRLQHLAFFVLARAITGGIDVQIRYFVAQNAIRAIAHMLPCPDNNVRLDGIRALQRIMEVGRCIASESDDTASNMYAIVFEECGGIASLEMMQQPSDTHTSAKNENVDDDIPSLATSLLQTFFEEIDEVSEATNEVMVSGDTIFHANSPD